MMNYYIRQTHITSSSQITSHFLAGTSSKAHPKKLIITQQRYVADSYRCVATNELGMASVSFIAPSAPNVTVASVTERSFTLEWKVSKNPTLNVTYLVNHTDLSYNTFTNLLSLIFGRYEVSGLQPYTLHNISVKGVNNLTSSSAVTVTVLTNAAGKLLCHIFFCVAMCVRSLVMRPLLFFVEGLVCVRMSGLFTQKN